MTPDHDTIEKAKARLSDHAEQPWGSYSCGGDFSRVDTEDLRRVLALVTTLESDLNTAIDALVSQTALVRSQAERVEALEAAGRAVVDRWDSPKWKDAEHTGVLIGRLRALLSGDPV